MSESAPKTQRPTATWLNLLMPGAGLIAVGAMASGLVVAMVFTIAANVVIVGVWIVPDDVPRVLTGLSIGVVVGVYIGAQFRLAQTLREKRRSQSDEKRREVLREVNQHLAAGDVDAAWAAIESVRALAETDLLVAYRRAQVLTARQDGAAAQRAWRHLKTLDRHHIYSEEIALHLSSDSRPTSAKPD